MTIGDRLRELGIEIPENGGYAVARCTKATISSTASTASGNAG